jgi:hypothetical protein
MNLPQGRPVMGGGIYRNRGMGASVPIIASGKILVIQKKMTTGFEKTRI